MTKSKKLRKWAKKRGIKIKTLKGTKLDTKDMRGYMHPNDGPWVMPRSIQNIVEDLKVEDFIKQHEENHKKMQEEFLTLRLQHIFSLPIFRAFGLMVELIERGPDIVFREEVMEWCRKHAKAIAFIHKQEQNPDY